MQKRKDLRFKPYYVGPDYWDTMEQELAFRYDRGDFMPRAILWSLGVVAATIFWALMVLIH